jgi:hypothetical protein
VGIEGESKNVYRYYHIRQRKVLTANVSNLRLFHPFLEVPFSGVPQETRRRTRDKPLPSDVVPLRTLKGAQDIKSIKEGDFFLADLPYNGLEPVAILKFISCDKEGSVTARWYGNYNMKWYINSRLAETPWKPGWYDPCDTRMYFQHRCHKPTDVPLTNIITIDDIPLTSIFVFNFKLRADDCLPRAVAQIGIRKYRGMTITDTDPDKGPVTYEDPNDDRLIEDPRHPPLRWADTDVIVSRKPHATKKLPHKRSTKTSKPSSASPKH